MRPVGSRSILLLLSTLTLACAAPSPGAPEQAQDAPAPAGALEQAVTPIAPSDGIHAEPAPAPASASEAEAGPASSAPSLAEPDALTPPPARGGGEADRSQSRLDIAVPSINGGLNRDIIRRTASDHADDIRDCHGRALASMPGLAGELFVELWIDERGRVTNAELTGPLNDRIGQCAVEVVMGWSFPDAGGAGSFKLTFDFAAQ